MFVGKELMGGMDEDDGDIAIIEIIEATRERQVNGGAARRGKGGGALHRLDVPGSRALCCLFLPRVIRNNRP